ncbi:hypothetical protein ABH991_002569 [Bradyrhizobium ottawaense]|uniref:Uncharacterized protein n=1 Tax=Bradyrhizobium ottawaense TaxID=931866 RepID=A0ABV4FL82_9BRAD
MIVRKLACALTNWLKQLRAPDARNVLLETIRDFFRKIDFARTKECTTSHHCCLERGPMSIAQRAQETPQLNLGSLASFHYKAFYECLRGRVEELLKLADPKIALLFLFTQKGLQLALERLGY